ncbi:MAG: MgtC/SapB family protein [Candidatus Omnitrophica bacterium]|nr:MgtC/SapB family protein [Candidatus Omnitrophota bacterium]MBU1925425.1 MgtC/SapB family protein [Candidatus Omnitrophota bacterium]
MTDSYQIMLRILLAAVLSGIVGFERELHGRAAGLRTTILVGVGSCLIMLTSMHLFELYKGLTTVDPGRIAAQVVSGIGFLGAGTILRFRASVRGLTTAAALWAVAGIGLAVGCGFFAPALISTSVIIIVLISLSRLENRIRRDVYKILKVEAKGGIEQLCSIRKVLADYQIEIKDMDIEKSPQENKFILSVQLKLSTDRLSSQVIETMSGLTGVTLVKWS